MFLAASIAGWLRLASATRGPRQHKSSNPLQQERPASRCVSPRFRTLRRGPERRAHARPHKGSMAAFTDLTRFFCNGPGGQPTSGEARPWPLRRERRGGGQTKECLGVPILALYPASRFPSNARLCNVRFELGMLGSFSDTATTLRRREARGPVPEFLAQQKTGGQVASRRWVKAAGLNTNSAQSHQWPERWLNPPAPVCHSSCGLAGGCP